MTTPRAPRVLKVGPGDLIPKGAVYVGRPGKWGNPFNIGKDGDRAEVIDKFRRWFYASDAMVAEARRELRGKDLVCWCAPLPCHADVLLKAANS